MLRIPWFGGDPRHLGWKGGDSERVRETRAVGHSDRLNVLIHSHHNCPEQGCWGHVWGSRR